MKQVRLPSYPLISLDPFMSLWSASDALSSPVCMWTGKEKPLQGTVTVDGKKMRFLGGKGGQVIPQQKIEIDLTATKYTFCDGKIEWTVTFTTPCLLKNLKLLSRPVSYIDFAFKSADGQKHTVAVTLSVGENIVYRSYKKPVVAFVEKGEGFALGKMGRKKQIPLADSGDLKEPDWGYVLLAGEADIQVSGLWKKSLVLTKTFESADEGSFYTVFGWDDVFSCEYFGKNVKGYWSKFYGSVEEAIIEAYRDHDETMELCRQEEESYRETEVFGEEYYTLLLASYRQVIAGHKLIDGDGEPIFVSKECSSNGCCVTVDITYPSAPIILTENPDLLKGMMQPVFTFARSKAWKYDFAPHDVGRFPYVMGQVYGIESAYNRHDLRDKKPPIFSLEQDNIFRYDSQMPVEESGNMIILAACYYNETGDKHFIKENFDLLSRWADYLVKTGIRLETQLSTDDFGGKIPQNVNLAIKSISAIALWGKLCNKLSKSSGNGYLETAKKYAEEIISKADRGDRLAIILDKEDGWSVKYNLVWDKIFKLGLFGERLWQRESDYYKTKLNRYGLPLDSRHTYGKTDWQIWASVLDKDDTSLRAYAKTLTDMLHDTPTRIPYPDLIETVAPCFNAQSQRKTGMYARTVQGGMWLPIYALNCANKKNFLM